MNFFEEEVHRILDELGMARSAVLVGGMTAAIDKFYYEEQTQSALMSGAVSGGATLAAEYVGPMVGLSGRGAMTLVSSALYTLVGPMIDSDLESQSRMQLFFKSVAAHVGAGVVGRTVIGGTMRNFANSIEAYSPSLGDMAQGP
jgi:hypothetical protein